MLIKQLKIIPEMGWEFKTYIIFTLIIGQFGLILPIIELLTNKGNNWSTFFESGIFYSTTIPLLGSSIYLIIKSTFFDEDVHFKGYKLFLIGISIIFIIFSSFLFSDLNNGKLTRAKIIFEIAVYIFSIILIIYSYLSLYLDLDLENFKDIDDKNIKKIIDNSKKRDKDNRGISL